MVYKKDWMKIKGYVENLKRDHNFQGLYHFTDFTNLKNIFDSGYLYSRNDCERNKIEFKDGANHDVLDKATNDVYESVRFYYRGKSPTLYNNEGVKLSQYCNDVHIPMPVYLLFDEKLLYLSSTRFSNGNATNSDIGTTYEFFSSMHWDAIFHDSVIYPEERDYIVNKRQAELLSNIPVSIEKYLKKIIFRCEADKKRAINVYGHNKKYEVDIDLFSRKNSNQPIGTSNSNNFIRDYSIDYQFDDFGNKVKMIVRVDYQQRWNDYDTKINIEDKNGLNMKESLEEFFDKYISKKEILYLNRYGEISSQSNDNYESKLLHLTGNIDSFNKFEIYINDYLYIEDFFNKEDIIEYEFEIKVINGIENLILHITFKDSYILGHSHRYEILDRNNNIIKNNTLKYREDSTSVKWYMTFNDYDESWYKIKYYIDDVMYICNLVHSININYATE